MTQLIATNQLTLTNVNDGTGHLKTWNFYKLSNSTTPPQTVPIGVSTNLSHLGPNNTWSPYIVLNGGSSGWGVIDFDKITKSNIVPDRPFTWHLEASFDGVSNFNGSTSFNIRIENWYTNSAGSNVHNPIGTRDHSASNFSATNDTVVNNYFSQSITWTVPRAVYDAIPEGGFLNLRIRIDRFTKLSYHAKNSYVTYGTVPSDPAKRGLGNYSTYGWKPYPEAVTQALPYLWIYQVQLYDNGREVAIPPAIIGAQGAPGPAGVSVSNIKPYFILSNTPTGVVRTSGTWSATPLTPTLSQKYVWTYLETTLSNGTKQYSEPYITGVYGDKGDQGVPGPPGADGRTIYIHWAYSDNADGTGLTTSDNGQRYIGQYSDNTQTDSTDKTKYKWADRWAKIDVGGTNQISLTGASVGHRIGTGGENISDSLHTVTKFIPVKYSNYVLSYDGELDSNTNFYYSLAWYSTQNVSGFISRPTGPARQTDLLNGMKLTPPANATHLRVSFPTNFNKVMLNGGTVKLNWSQSPEDIQADIDTKADQALTLEQKRELEVRMGIIENELKARALLAETEAWFDEYTKYKTSLDTDKKESETKLADLSSRIDTAVKNLGDMSVRWNFLDIYMKPGNEGLMIGKMDGTTSIRVSDNRIAFYSGGKEVAFISNNTLEIENGIFTTQLQVGRFQISQYGPNPDANIVRYVGGR